MFISVGLKSAKICCCALAVMLLMTITVCAQTYYVDANGSNAGDGSSAKPWASLSYACSRAVSSGDIIRVNAGNYTDNNPCYLAIGISIRGAGSDRVTINTSASPFIRAESSVPVKDGNNEISGIKFDGNDRSATVILSRGRNNQKFHDCVFEDFTGRGVMIYGRYGLDDNSGEFWRDNCSSSTSAAGTWCYNDPSLSVEPKATDWAWGVAVYNNTFNDCKIFPSVVAGAKIHDNVFNNDGTYGPRRSAIGHTAYWFDGVEIYNNDIRIGAQGWSVIAIEMWEIKNNSKFYNNTSDSWFSLRGSTHGLDDGYTANYEIFNNTFAASYYPPDPQSAIEVMSDVQGAEIYNNYFYGSAWGYGVAIWGADSGGKKSGVDVLRNITIRNNVFHKLSNGGSLGGVHASSNQANTLVENIRIYNNVFDANRQAINLGDGPGTIRNIFIKNNVFTNQTDKAIVTNGSGMGSVYIDHNLSSGNNTWLGDWAGAISESNTLRAAAEFQKTGDRPTPFYLPTGGDANLVDAGVDVGLSFSGTAPDLGAFEWNLNTLPLPAPRGLFFSDN